MLPRHWNVPSRRPEEREQLEQEEGEKEKEKGLYEDQEDIMEEKETEKENKIDDYTEIYSYRPKGDKGEMILKKREIAKQPLRAKHCQVCRQCVHRYDHHCPWIENCIGERNHPLFVLYLGVQLTVLLWALQVAWSGLNFQSFSWLWLQCHLLLLLSFLLLCVCAVIATLLLGSHLYLVSCNTTTWEFMSRHRISYLKHCKVENPFDQGVPLNLWRFFCACRLMAWEKLYPPEETELV